MNWIKNLGTLIQNPAKWLLSLFVVSLAISYIGLALIYDHWFLFTVVVHEDGKQTFLGLLLNSSHFLREVPVSLMMCLGVVGSYLHVFPGCGSHSSIVRQQKTGSILWLLAAVMLLVGMLITAASHGITSIWHELMQYKTRGELLEYGSHWNYHFLHTLFMPIQALAGCLWIGLLTGRITSLEKRPPYPLIFWAILFLLAWIVFGFKMTWRTEALYLAHQLREVGTHGLVSICLMLGICFWLDRRSDGRALPREHPKNAYHLFLLGVSSAVSLLIPIYLAWSLRNVEILEMAQKKAGYLELYFSHNFEHFLDYILMGLVAAALFLSLERQGNTLR